MATMAPASSTTGVDSGMGSCGEWIALVFQWLSSSKMAEEMPVVQQTVCSAQAPEPQLPQVFPLPPGPGH